MVGVGGSLHPICGLIGAPKSDSHVALGYLDAHVRAQLVDMYSVPNNG